ncbi:hypothetical protein V2A60_003910 [Cordyceps javanica]
MLLLLPASFISLALQASSSAAERSPTALRKVAPDAGEKIFPEHLAFATISFEDASIAARQFLEAQDALPRTARQRAQAYRPAFARHHADESSSSRGGVLRWRAANKAFGLLQSQRRAASCPRGMSGCDAIGQPNKCCQDGTVCTAVEDDAVGGIACCPQGSSCGGRVGTCPSDAVSCPAALGGGCCIPGYVCEGVGCVPSASATDSTTATKTTATTIVATSPATTITVTSTRTTWVDGAPSTVVVTEVVTQTASRAPSTTTTTVTVTESGSTVTGGAPWRPTDTTTTTTMKGGSSSSGGGGKTTTGTQEGCPTGFYGCLATHGGGCCQTDRDCRTSSCPPQASTTIVSDGRTVVVPASDVLSTAASNELLYRVGFADGFGAKRAAKREFGGGQCCQYVKELL